MWPRAIAAAWRPATLVGASGAFSAARQTRDAAPRCDAGGAWQGPESSPPGPVLFSFGLITDVQYADQADRAERQYRNTLSVIDNAVLWWRRGPQLAFVLHAGDIIDEGAQVRGVAASHQALVEVTDRLSRLEIDVVCLVGNHELYNFTRAELRAWSPGKCRFADAGGMFFYRYDAPVEVSKAGWRFLVLDAYDSSVLSEGRGLALNRDALAAMCERNPNFKRYCSQNPGADINNLNKDVSDWFSGVDEGAARRWTPMNGGLSQEQLEWLKRELAEASALGLSVGIFSHVGVKEQTGAGGELMVWNYEFIMDAIQDPVRGACVQFVMSGHRHSGGFCTDSSGIHHCNFESPLHASPDQQGVFARVDICEHFAVIRGYALEQTDFQRQKDYGRVLEDDAKDPSAERSRVLALRRRGSGPMRAADVEVGH